MNSIFNKVRNTAFSAYISLFYNFTSRFPIGKNIYTLGDWDLVIILDACRVDALKQVADEYDYIGDVKTIYSVGSHSHEWMAKTFTERFKQQIQNTRYITANTHAEILFEQGEDPPRDRDIWGKPSWKFVESYSFKEIDKAWEYGYDDRIKNVPPRVITDRTIEKMRDSSGGRVISHYVQPHAPYISDAMNSSRELTEIERRPLQLLSDKRVDKDIVWKMYLENLRLALDEVEIVLDNVDADSVLITADHGEAFGELGFVDHPGGFPHPAVKSVPLVRTTATNYNTHNPAEIETENNSVSVEQHLKDLGYL